MKKHVKKAGAHVKKHVVGTHKPHKPLLKRHITILTFSFLVAAILIIQLIINAVYFYRFQDQAQQIVQQASNVESSSNLSVINSSLGFSLEVNLAKFNVRASEVLSDGSLQTYVSENTAQTRPYSIVQITPGADSAIDAIASRLNVLTSEENNGVDTSTQPNKENLEKVALQFAEKSSNAFDVKKTQSTTVTINDTLFLKERFVSVPKYTSQGNLTFSDVGTTVWTTYANGRVFGIKLTGVPASVETDSFNQIISSFEINTPSSVSFESKLSSSVNDVAKSIPLAPEKLLDRLTGTQPVFAQSTGDSFDSSRIVATNSPAVVKIYSITCGSIVYFGSTVFNDCDGGTGSGFVLSDDGYVGTNGHVVSRTAKDVLFNSILYGPTTLERMLRAEGYTESQIKSIISELRTNQNLIASVAASVYEVEDSKVRFGSDVTHHNLAVFNSTPPSIEGLLNGTKNKVEDTEDVKNGKIIASDFVFSDLLSTEFEASDVALLKLEGTNYPHVNLGAISDVATGSNLTVVGYPGSSENQLVDTTIIEPTATQGVVSAVRNTNDGEHQVIQSDVAIGHGNSGGPAFANNGSVVGIATYTFASETGSGDANVSYMRDIADLVELAEENDVNELSESNTQSDWEEGIDLFYQARFTKAIAKFEKVKELFPGHRLAETYIDLAQTKIDNGEEVAEPSNFILYGLGAGASIGGIVAGIVLIINQKKRHKDYVSGAVAHQPQFNQPPTQPTPQIVQPVLHTTPTPGLPQQQPPHQVAPVQSTPPATNIPVQPQPPTQQQPPQQPPQQPQ